MRAEHLAGRARPSPHLRAPVSAALWQRDLLERPAGERVEHCLLVGDVVVERHRLDAGLSRNTSHAHGRQSASVRDAHGCLEDAPSA